MRRLVVLAAMVGCRSKEHAPPPSPAPAPPPVQIDAAVAPLPPPPPPVAFVGSSRCSDCHDKEYKGWKKSWHARALSPAEKQYVVGNFDHAHFKGASSEAWMTTTRGKPVMRTHGPDGELADFPVDWVVGGKRMQDSITVFPDGRWQVLPVYFHTTKHEWVDYTEAKQGALTPDHPFYWTNARRMANHECLDCHTTNLDVGYDEASHKWTTSFTDGGVACESCHGPGGKHGDTKADIIHPVHAGAVGVEACARCHGPRNPLWPLNDPEHPFRLGVDRYDDYYDPIVVTIPGDGISSDFFADGRPATSSFEYQAMLQSACYRKGGATCLTCHTAPHNAKLADDLRKQPDALCHDCHADLPADHGHHKAVRCIDCHMPPIVSGVLDHFADHSLDVPDPKLALTHHEPNACTVCHADKPTDQLIAAVAKWWPDAGKRQARRERLADAFDEDTAQASAPALVAVITDKDEAPTLRGAAAIVLGRRGGARTAGAITPLLADPSVILRAKACEALGDAHATSAGDVVAQHLGDRELRVQLACALALLDMHDGRAEAALQKLADAPATSHLMLPHLELGMAAGRRKDFATAKQQLTWVAKLSPSYSDALVDLAATDAELGDFAAARSRIEQVLQLEPHHRGALALQAKLPH